MVTKKPRWKKVLYLKQPYPDNYIDKKTFLSDLRTKVKYVPLPTAIKSAVPLLQEFGTVIGFVLIYVCLINEWISPEIVINCSNFATIVSFLLYRIVYKCKNNLNYDLRTVLIFLVFGLLFSPVLYTLTDTISTDTIYTMTFLTMLVHLLFFDYGVNAALVSNTLSLNAAIFGSICLASRLSSAYEAFILLTLAIEVFVLFPILRKNMENSVIIALILFSFDFYVLFLLSYTFLFIFVVISIFVNIICPILFVKFQKYKMNIYGPWDEAIVQETIDFKN